MGNREENYIGITGIIKNFSQTFFRYCSDLVRLAKLEAALAKRSFIQMCILSSIALIFLLTTVLGIFAFIVVGLMMLGLNLLASLGITIGINLLIVVGILLYVLKLKNNLNFTATRKQLSFREKGK